MKLRLHPLFFVALFAYTLLGGVKEYLVALLAVVIHELSHAFLAHLVGAKGIAVILTPYGATMSAAGEIPHFGWVLVAGPLSNLILASIALSACWLIPELYGSFKGFVRANALIATVNLLPAYPLDGGRLCRLIFPVKGVRVATSLCTLVVALTAMVFALFYRNLSLLLFGGFMLSYFFAFSLKRAKRVSVHDPIYALAGTDEEGRFLSAVVREGKKKVGRLSSHEIAAILLGFPRETEIGKAIAARDGRREI